MMIKNLIKRKCPLLSIEEYPDVDSQIKRFKDFGYKNSFGLNMYEFYEKINKDIRKKIEKIEGI
jgi:hypothetical protein